MSGFDPTFLPSGTGSRAGSVPDPGSVAGIARYLREDATWFIPTSVGPIPPPPSPGPGLDQWACNVAGFLTYSVTRATVKVALDGIALPVITDAIAIAVQGLLNIFVPELIALDAAFATAIADLVSTYITGHIADFVAYVLDDIFWAKLHCYIYDSVVASPSNFAVALAAAATVLNGSGLAPTWVLNGVALILQHLGFSSFVDIPLSAFVTHYDCSSCAMTGEAGAVGPLQSSFDLVVSHGTTRETFVSQIEFPNAVVSAAGSVATVETDVTVEKAGTAIGVRPAINIVDGSNITSTVTDDVANNRVNVSIATSGALGMVNPMTTPADLIVGTTAGAPVRLGKGSDGQVLTVDPTTHLLVWSTPAAGFVNPMTSVDDVIIGATAGVAARLGVGSAGKFLGTDPVSGHIAYESLVAGSGITLVQSAGQTQIATAGTGVGGTACTQIGKVTLPLAVAGIAFTSIPATFSMLMLEWIIRCDSLAGTAVGLQLRFNNDSAANYNWMYYGLNPTSNSTGAGFAATSAQLFVVPADGTGNIPHTTSSGTLWVPNYAATAHYNQYHGLASIESTPLATGLYAALLGGSYAQLSAISRIDLFVAVGNMEVGSEATLWGFI